MIQEKEKKFRELIRGLEMGLEKLNKEDCLCCNVTLTQCHVLVEIGRKEHMMLKEVAQILNIDTSTASKTVDELVKKELVLRTQMEKDRRGIQLVLSEKGVQSFKEIEEHMDLKFQKIFLQVPEEERENLLHALELLNKAF